MTAPSAAQPPQAQPPHAQPPQAQPAKVLSDVARESVSIPARAAKLLATNLSMLLTLICLGLAGRQAIIWLAVWLSNFSSFAASLVMPLAPVCVMLSLIFCLWQLRPSLPFLAATFPDRAETSTRNGSNGDVDTRNPKAPGARRRLHRFGGRPVCRW